MIKLKDLLFERSKNDTKDSGGVLKAFLETEIKHSGK